MDPRIRFTVPQLKVPQAPSTFEEIADLELDLFFATGLTEHAQCLTQCFLAVSQLHQLAQAWYYSSFSWCMDSKRFPSIFENIPVLSPCKRALHQFKRGKRLIVL